MPGLTLDILNTLATGLGWGLIIGGALVFAVYYLRPSEPAYFIEKAPEPEEPADPWEGFEEARRKHPLPAAHAELEALEVDGPIHVHRPEVIVRAGR